MKKVAFAALAAFVVFSESGAMDVGNVRFPEVKNSGNMVVSVNMLSDTASIQVSYGKPVTAYERFEFDKSGKLVIYSGNIASTQGHRFCCLYRGGVWHFEYTSEKTLKPSYISKTLSGMFLPEEFKKQLQKIALS